MDTTRKTLDLQCYGGPYDGSVLTVAAWCKEVVCKQFESSPCTHVYAVTTEDDGSRFLKYAGEVCPVDG